VLNRQVKPVTSITKLTLRPPAPADDKRQRVLDAALKRTGFRQDALIEVLHSAQNAFGYLTPELLWYVAGKLRLPASRVYGVATFYNFFSLKPPGDHTVIVCQGTACYIRGATKLADAIESEFGVAPGETSRDGVVSVAIARCLGSCGMAPVLVVDGTIVGRATPSDAVVRLHEAITSPALPPNGALEYA
jgi:bidirectional [NiFe] hydrogenase diaphorase subunit